MSVSACVFVFVDVLLSIDVSYFRWLYDAKTLYKRQQATRKKQFAFLMKFAFYSKQINQMDGYVTFLRVYK